MLPDSRYQPDATVYLLRVTHLYQPLEKQISHNRKNVSCKDSAKFRLSEGNENIFLFLSVRKLIKLSEIQRKSGFFSFISEMQPIFSEGER
jgi:hypothetical protein